MQEELKKRLAMRNKPAQPAANLETPTQDTTTTAPPKQNPPIDMPKPQNMPNPMPMPVHKKPMVPPPPEKPIPKADMDSTISKLEAGSKTGPPPVQIEKVVVNKGAPPPPMLNLGIFIEVSSKILLQKALPPMNLAPPKPQVNAPVNKPKATSNVKPKEEVKKPEPQHKPEHTHHKIFDPIPAPKFEVKPLPEEVKAEPPKMQPAKRELPKLFMEPPKMEPAIKIEPPKMEPPKMEPVIKMEPPKMEPPKMEQPKMEPPKMEPPKMEPPKMEPPPKLETPIKMEQPKVDPPRMDPPQREEPLTKQDPQKPLEFKDQVRNLRFPTLAGLDAAAGPKKDKKKLIFCVSHQNGFTATQEEVSN